jgi:hypothetical protein
MSLTTEQRRINGRIGGIASGVSRRANPIGMGRKVLGQRVCACGCNEPFLVTSRNPGQKFKDATHLDNGWRAEMVSKARKATTYRHRRCKFQRAVEEVLRRKAITLEMLTDLGAMAYRMGYSAGWTRGKWQTKQKREAA